MSADPIDWDGLARAAWRAREEAYAPYSHYRVGAALLAEDGRVFQGANVENASYGLCLCAERAAVGAAVTNGARRFAAIVVVTGGETPGSPCGMCRQVMCEFAPAFPVRCIAESGAMLESSTDALLPFAFTPASLGVEIEGARSTLLLGSSERSDTEPPPAAAFAGVALKVAAGTGSELAELNVASDDTRGGHE